MTPTLFDTSRDIVITTVTLWRLSRQNSVDTYAVHITESTELSVNSKDKWVSLFCYYNYLVMDKVVILKKMRLFLCCWCRSNKENDKANLKIERIIWFGIFHRVLLFESFEYNIWHPFIQGQTIYCDLFIFFQFLIFREMNE